MDKNVPSDDGIGVAGRRDDAIVVEESADIGSAGPQRHLECAVLEPFIENETRRGKRSA